MFLLKRGLLEVKRQPSLKTGVLDWMNGCSLADSIHRQHILFCIIDSGCTSRDVLQSYFDLLGELMKFNIDAFKRFNKYVNTPEKVQFCTNEGCLHNRSYKTVLLHLIPPPRRLAFTICEFVHSVCRSHVVFTRGVTWSHLEPSKFLGLFRSQLALLTHRKKVSCAVPSHGPVCV